MYKLLKIVCIFFIYIFKGTDREAGETVHQLVYFSGDGEGGGGMGPLILSRDNDLSLHPGP